MRLLSLLSLILLYSCDNRLLEGYKAVPVDGWERVYVKPDGTEENISLRRLKVPGGWLVRTLTQTERGYDRSITTFVLDPAHSWKLGGQ